MWKLYVIRCVFVMKVADGHPLHLLDQKNVLSIVRYVRSPVTTKRLALIREVWTMMIWELMKTQLISLPKKEGGQKDLLQDFTNILSTVELMCNWLFAGLFLIEDMTYGGNLTCSW